MFILSVAEGSHLTQPLFEEKHPRVSLQTLSLETSQPQSSSLHGSRTKRSGSCRCRRTATRILPRVLSSHTRVSHPTGDRGATGPSLDGGSPLLPEGPGRRTGGGNLTPEDPRLRLRRRFCLGPREEERQEVQGTVKTRVKETTVYRTRALQFPRDEEKEPDIPTGRVRSGRGTRYSQTSPPSRLLANYPPLLPSRLCIKHLRSDFTFQSRGTTECGH